MKIEFFAGGTPAPKGSKRHVGHGVLVESSKRAKPWAGAVSVAAMQAMGERPPLSGVVRVAITFYLARPKAHFLRGKLRDTAPIFCTSHGKGDGDKLCRCTWDALTGISYTDDALIASWQGEKLYSNDGRTGARISIEAIAPQLTLSV